MNRALVSIGMWADGVPLPMGVVARELEAVHLGLGGSDALGVGVDVQAALDDQSGRAGGRGEQAQAYHVAHQRMAQLAP